VAISRRENTPAAVNFLLSAARSRGSKHKTKAAAPFSTAAPELKRLRRLAEVVRHVVERRVQLVADALHRANRRNGDESGDQAVLNGGRTLFVLNQLEKLAHGLSSLVPSAEASPPHLQGPHRRMPGN